MLLKDGKKDEKEDGTMNSVNGMRLSERMFCEWRFIGGGKMEE